MDTSSGLKLMRHQVDGGHVIGLKGYIPARGIRPQGLKGICLQVEEV